MTPSAAKNAIRRAIYGVVDPYPSASEVDRIWQSFESSCVYCGKLLVRGNRNAHIDHLAPSGTGGTNALGNFVLSCGTCNGDEKRDERWDAFLRKKAGDNPTFERRKNRIDAWVASCGPGRLIDPAVELRIAAEVKQVIAAFDGALARVRQLGQKRERTE
jgi:hypothetical protein